tara:strand:- start:330 stop:698 length:369 start_codon:yes stop_codon:yes gene_type:complete
MNFEEAVDRAISEGLNTLHEEKYKLRTFEMELLIRIDAEFGVEETLQDIRSISGVTVVTAMDSLFRKNSGSYLSHIKIKFHPKSESVTPKTFVQKHLLPLIRGQEIPGTKVVRIVSQARRIG